MIRRPPRSPLFPHPPLFRSQSGRHTRTEQPRRHPAVPEGESSSAHRRDRKSTRLNSSHGYISYAVFCLKKKIEPAHLQGVGNSSLIKRPAAANSTALKPPTE